MDRLHLNARREGFALPMAILLVGFITAGLVGAFARQRAEYATIMSGSSQTNAFAVADAGLNAYLAAGATNPATATYTFPKGTAVVTATEIRAAATSNDTAIWLVQSVGTANGGSMKNPPARRIVAQLAYTLPSTMQVLSSWTSLSGIIKNGNSGSIAGADACPPPNNQATKPGAMMPDGTFSGDDSPFSGAPAIDTTMTQAQLANAIKIDWAGIVNPAVDALGADIVVNKPSTNGYNSAWTPRGTFPSSFPAGYWPTILINGSSPLPANGRGTLIITGDLTFGGSDTWQGIILVGGAITDNGSGNISGAVVSGLNVKLGQTVPQSSKANGTKDYKYNSCDVASATAARRKLTSVDNAWMDTWNAW
ncbi:MAG TPA: hypothetical protein VF035_02585 [Longimicrobiales bacterium]